MDSGHTAWMLTASALVFFMTPGLAFFYGGLVRAKSLVNTIMLSFITIGIISKQLKLNLFLSYSIYIWHSIIICNIIMIKIPFMINFCRSR